MVNRLCSGHFMMPSFEVSCSLVMHSEWWSTLILHFLIADRRLPTDAWSFNCSYWSISSAPRDRCQWVKSICCNIHNWRVTHTLLLLLWQAREKKHFMVPWIYKWAGTLVEVAVTPTSTKWCITAFINFEKIWLWSRWSELTTSVFLLWCQLCATQYVEVLLVTNSWFMQWSETGAVDPSFWDQGKLHHSWMNKGEPFRSYNQVWNNSSPIEWIYFRLTTHVIHMVIYKMYIRLIRLKKIIQMK